MNSIWLVIGSLAAFAVAYRYYGAFLAAKVADRPRATTSRALAQWIGTDAHRAIADEMARFL